MLLPCAPFSIFGKSSFCALEFRAVNDVSQTAAGSGNRDMKHLVVYHGFEGETGNAGMIVGAGDGDEAETVACGVAAKCLV